MSQPTAMSLDQVDLTDLDAFARNEGWAMFDTLRAEDPVHWTPEAAPNSGFWAVTRYAAIDAGGCPHGAGRARRREVHVDAVCEPRGSRRRPDGPAALDSRDRWVAPPSIAEA